jgi:BlaI family transcriptional regulator, penicillinase repressor
VSKLKLQRLGELQLRILKILWDQKEATVATVHERLQAESDLAYTTVATMLRKMEVRGLVRHRTEGRTFVYEPAVGAEQVNHDLTGHLLNRLFEGSLASMVSHLLTHRQVSGEELAELERLIAKRKERK